MSGGTRCRTGSSRFSSREGGTNADGSTRSTRGEVGVAYCSPVGSITRLPIRSQPLLLFFYQRYFSEDRYCEVVRCHKGLWIHHARRRQQRRLRASFGGAGLWIQEPGRRSTSDLRRQTRPQRLECG